MVDSTPATTPDSVARLDGSPDYEVIRCVLAGDDRAYEVVMRRYNRFLYRVARGILGNDEEARDVVQECYIRAYFALADFRGPGGFPSWLARIAINEASARRRKKSLPAARGESKEPSDTEVRRQPEAGAMSLETIGYLERAIDALPGDFRMVFILRGVEQLSVAETAEHLDINPGTVKTRFFRAKAMLRAHLEKHLDDIAPTTFQFAGADCDAIVAYVLTAIAKTGLRPA